MRNFLWLIVVVILLIALVAISGCATPTAPAVNEYDSNGRILRSTVQMTSADYADTQIAAAKRDCQEAFYAQSKVAGESKDQMLMFAIQGLAGVAGYDPCRTITSRADVEIVKSNNRWGSLNNFISKIPIIGGIVGGTIVGKEAVKNKDPVDPIILEQPDPIILEPQVIEIPSGGD